MHLILWRYCECDAEMRSEERGGCEREVQMGSSEITFRVRLLFCTCRFPVKCEYFLRAFISTPVPVEMEVSVPQLPFLFSNLCG